MRFISGADGGDLSWWWVPGLEALHSMLATARWRVTAEHAFGDGPAERFATSHRYLLAETAGLAAALQSAQLPEHEVRNRFALGHYYSPLPDHTELAAELRRSQVWPATPRATPGIDWRDTRAGADLSRRLRRAGAHRPGL